MPFEPLEPEDQEDAQFLKELADLDEFAMTPPRPAFIWAAVITIWVLCALVLFLK